MQGRKESTVMVQPKSFVEGASLLIGRRIPSFKGGAMIFGGLNTGRKRGSENSE